jgi:predicted outer membrane repeat protein
VYATLVITSINAQFIGNVSQIAGAGGVYASASLILTSTQFLSNSASFEGGGAAARDTAMLSGGLFQNNQAGNSGGGLHAYGSAILTGTRFISNTASYGGGAYVALTATVVNGAWIGNHAVGLFGAGGALYAGTLFMTSTQLINNQVDSGYGGGLYAVGQATLTGGSVEQNYAFNGGGGLYAQAAVSISGTQILSNTGLYGGGGVFGDSVGLTNSRVENNTASQDRGGGVFAHDALIVNTQFISNSAQSVGGGLYATGVMDGSQRISINIIGSVFERNSLSDLLNSQGGGLYALEAASISGTQFLTNSAGASGGGAYISNTAVLSNVIFSGNTSPHSVGGGLYTRRFATIRSGQFISNSALGGGGLFSFAGAEVRSADFKNNAASFNGGGVFVYGLLTLIDDRFISNTAADSTGGAYASGPLRAYDSHFENNRALTGEGGALYAENNIQISKTLIISNSAHLGGGVYLYCGQGYIVNSLFARNTASTAGINPGQGAALALNDCTNSSFFSAGNVKVVHTTIADTRLNPRQAIAIFSGTLNVTNTIITSHSIAISNTGGTVYEDYNLFFGNPIVRSGLGIISGAHAVFSDPKFVDPVHNNFHILAGSAAINTAINAGVSIDFDGQARPFGPGFDIGYDEYVALKVYLPIVLKNH